MTAEDIQAIAALIQALGWPLLVLFLVLYFGDPLKKFLMDLSEFSFKAGASGLEATAKSKQIQAAALLGAASAKSDVDRAVDQTSPEDRASQIAAAVSQAVQPRSIRRLAESTVLWVDDNPANNVNERRALEALGIRITLSSSTDDALEKLRRTRFDAIVTDMSRPPDHQAGFTLIDASRGLGNRAPVVIYAARNTPELKMEARAKGAYGCTNDPQDLFQFVVTAIQTN